MSGIIPPSIVTYQYTVDRNFSKYVNVSFPFRVKIEGIWFTGDRALLGGSDLFDNYRALKLSALKAKTTKYKYTAEGGNPTPSDWAPFFGVYDAEDGDNGAWWAANSDYKPTLWLGNPDDLAQYLEETGNRTTGQTTQWIGRPWYDAGFRSTVGYPAPASGQHNPYWYNDDYNWQEWEKKKYKTDLSIMNTDEILSLFVFDQGGNWDWYDGTGVATIHIAYTGVGGADQVNDGNVNGWWNWWD